MTGFGAAEGPVGGGTIRVEIRSVNHRYFNLALKAPADLLPLELEVRERLRRAFERGHFAVQVRWTAGPEGAGPGAVRLNAAGAAAAMDRLRALQAAVGLAGEIPLDLVARQPDVFAADDDAAGAVPWSELEVVVAEAAAQCRAMRRREGADLARELALRLGAIREGARAIAALAPARLIRERDRLRSSVAALLEGRPVDDDRLAHEIALLADRLDVTEELVRLEAHLDAAAAALGADDKPVGKQLGFLAQEIGREINTIGSKANDAAIQHTVVEMKGDLERFLEQLENLE
jgi:uncharacterized protein (TIGR00255 family)